MAVVSVVSKELVASCSSVVVSVTVSDSVDSTASLEVISRARVLDDSERK